MKVKRLVMTAVFTALVFVTTAYILHIPIPATGGYVHIGDAVIYLAAACLPLPYAIFTASVGAGLCDALFAPVYVIPTIIIKAILVLFFTNKKDKIICKRNVIALVLAGVTGVLCYYAVDAFLYFDKNFLAALSTLPMSFVQPAASAAAFLIIGVALDKLNFKKLF